VPLATAHRRRPRRCGGSRGTVISVIVLGSVQPAFAGWSAAPSPASASEVTTADSAFQAKLASSPGFADSSGWNAVTTDVRGPFTVVIFQEGGSGRNLFYRAIVHHPLS
jgi:hypothetical protein